MSAAKKVRLAPSTVPINASQIVDDLGLIKAQIADLERKEATLRDLLIESGQDSAEGEFYRATVSRTEVETIGYKAVVEALPPSSNLTRLINLNTATKPRTTVKVVSR